MKVKKSKNNKMDNIYPKYKLVIPILMCMYMITSLFVEGIGNKSVLLTITCVSMVAWFIGERIFPEKIYRDSKGAISKWIYILLGIFLIAVVLSEIFAKDYSDSVLIGEGESIVNIFCYIILFYMAYKYADGEKNQKIFRLAIITLCVLCVVMSMIEFFDIPLAKIWNNSGESLSDINRVVLSFGNSNYYGAFCGILLPFAVKLWIDAEDKIRKIAYIVLNAALICCIFMSKSTMAVFLMILVMVGTSLYYFKDVLKRWKYMLIFIVTLIIEILVINICSGGKLLQLINIGISNNDAFKEENQEKYIIEDIKLNGNRLIIEGVDSKFIIEYNNQFIFLDGEGQILDINTEDNVIRFVEKPYDGIEVMVSYNRTVNMVLVEVDAGYKDTVDFYIANGEFKGVGADGKAVDDISGKYTDHKMKSLFTGRGYIWINIVPILDEVIFIGKGSGNFVNVFKQYDYVGLLKSQGTSNIIIDRPHNMFLQYSMDIGVVGTVALFGMIMIILCKWVRENVKRGRDNRLMSYPTFAGIVVFLMFSMLNDSLVILSPYMWLGLGLNLGLPHDKK